MTLVYLQAHFIFVNKWRQTNHLFEYWYVALKGADEVWRGSILGLVTLNGPVIKALANFTWGRGKPLHVIINVQEKLNKMFLDIT